ncbi:hypothetical protein [Pseudonocardia sediminis]|uniref:hypothetical protein n=1 Tax=Pseudonocardia sediminis TaxID=1397368 RepID=UPI00102917E7|nr:hypothetical protein [Pseudonocardia sediminis]
MANQIKGDGVDLREAQLAVFIEVALGDILLVDVEAIDLVPIHDAVSSEIKRTKIRHPWIYGRSLYDAVADSGLNEDPFPTPDETENLLKDAPHGVFQHGPYVTGPLGLLESTAWRYIPARTAAPALHCEEPDCHSVHSVHLSSFRTGVAKAQDAIRDRNEKTRRSGNRLVEAVDRVEVRKQAPYRWNNMDTVPFFLADCFSLEERRMLLVRLLDETSNRMRSACVTAVPDDEVRSAKEWVENRSEAEIMQLTLLASDEELHTALNQLVWSSDIEIPDGETRAAMIMAHGTGPFRMRVEASNLGVRFHPPAVFLQLRLRDLIGGVFPPENDEHDARLSWLLRGHDGETGRERLTSALASESPVRIVEKLLISDERAYRASLEHLGLPSGRFDEKSDEFLAKLIAWHVGFSIDEQSIELTSARSMLHELRTLVQALPIDGLDRHQMNDVRGVAGKLFPAVEAALKRVVRFVAWTALRDHYALGRTLEFTDSAAEAFFDDWIQPYSSNLEKSRTSEMALADLVSCFGILSKHLRDLMRRGVEFERSSSDMPRAVRDWGSPFSFPFRHTLPFLDFDSASQLNITDALTKVASGFHTEKVLNVRNALLHDSEAFPGNEEIQKALNEIDARLGVLAASGLYPAIFRFVNSDVDDVGRERTKLRSPDGVEISLQRPSQLDLSLFPTRSGDQIMVRSARLRDAPEPMRFAHVHDSAFQGRWANFPRRPKRRLSFNSEMSR